MIEKRIAKHDWIDGKRYHRTPYGHLPGVTTITGATGDKSFLKAWRDRVGEEEANRITKEATDRGTKLHEAIEAYYETGELSELPLFQQIYPVLQDVECIVAESQIYHPLGYAGTFDMLGYYEDKITLIDWKSASKSKRPDWIKDYYLQVAAYIKAINHLYNLDIENGLIVIAVEGQTIPQIFPVGSNELPRYWDSFCERLKQYQERFGDF